MELEFTELEKEFILDILSQEYDHQKELNVLSCIDEKYFKNVIKKFEKYNPVECDF